MSERDQKTQTERVEHTRRYVRRNHSGGVAFYPFGLIPAAALLLLSLFALLPFASLWIEDNAEQAALTSLRQGGHGWAEVSASGQWITLSGDAPSAERAAAAVELVRSARAPTLFGPARPVTRVIDRTVIAGEAVADTVIAATPEDAPDPVPADPAPSDPETIIAAERERVAACDQSLKDLLTESKIEFASGSARIAPASSGLLDQLARAIQGCDLDIVIEGHTDSTGSAELNARLSLDRASAVRDALVIRGVSADLLAAEGYGEDRPVADNDTPQGREQNRRIEFNVRSLSDPQE
ncbi:MAG: OmpA family protein [Hyphomonadaceae bacterium]|nr:OmpA family protein [Hyphomonadaceae bacterium]